MKDCAGLPRGELDLQTVRRRFAGVLVFVHSRRALVGCILTDWRAWADTAAPMGVAAGEPAVAGCRRCQRSPRTGSGDAVAPAGWERPYRLNQSHGGASRRPVPRRSSA